MAVWICVFSFFLSAWAGVKVQNLERNLTRSRCLARFWPKDSNWLMWWPLMIVYCFVHPVFPLLFFTVSLYLQHQYVNINGLYKKRGHNKRNAIFCLTHIYICIFFLIQTKYLVFNHLLCLKKQQCNLISLHIDLDISVSVGYFWFKCLDAT